MVPLKKNMMIFSKKYAKNIVYTFSVMLFIHNIQAEKFGGEMDEESANLYYTPAEREDELIQQLKRQRIKSIPISHIKYAYKFVMQNDCSNPCRQLGVLGSGEFGTVCKGEWVYADKKLDVAIKILSDSSDETNKVKFLQEAAIMSQFRHPNVIKLYGVVTNGQQVDIQ